MKLLPLVLLCACHSAPANLITTFTASPAMASDGQPITLHAIFHGGTGSVDGQPITSGVDIMTPAVRASGLPQETVTFTLAVKAGGAIAQTATASVVVTRLPTTPVISARATVNAHEENLIASVTPEDGVTYEWTVSGGTADVLTGPTITYSAGDAGTLTLTCTATNAGGTAVASAPFAARVVGVVLIAGAYAQAGESDGAGPSARFTLLQGVAVDVHDTIYATDTTSDGASFVRRIMIVNGAYVVDTIAGSAGPGVSTPCTNGFGSAAYFNDARDLAYDAKQDQLVLAEHGAAAGGTSSTSRVRLVTGDGSVSTAYVAYNIDDMCSPGAQYVPALDQVGSVAIDANDRVWAATESGVVLNLASSATLSGVTANIPIGHIAFGSDGSLLFSSVFSASLQRSADFKMFTGFVDSGFPATDAGPGEATTAAPGALITKNTNTTFIDGDLLRSVAPDGTVTTLVGVPALTRQTLVALAPGELDAMLVGVAALSTGDLILITPTAVLLARLPEGAL